MMMDVPYHDRVPLSRFMTLAAVPNAVMLSRSLATITLRRWGLRRMIDDATLVTSELVTNAVEATGGEDAGIIHVRVTHLVSSIVIEVWDRDPTPPKPSEADPDAENGRGLMIVEALCVRWDYFHSIGGGKVVWAELAIPERALKRLY